MLQERQKKKILLPTETISSFMELERKAPGFGIAMKTEKM